MVSKFRTFFTAAIFTLLLSLLAFGCGSDSSTSQPGGAGTAASSLSPDGVAMVNGKEITKADLAEDMRENQLVAKNQGSEFPKPGTPEYAEKERLRVGSMVDIEVNRLEAENMGISVNDDEINTLMDQDKAQFGGEAAFNQGLLSYQQSYDRYKEVMGNNFQANKLFLEVTKNIAAAADAKETSKQAKELFKKWQEEAKGKYVIIYADQYKPASTTT